MIPAIPKLSLHYKRILFFGLLLFIVQCSYYNEATNKKNETKKKNELTNYLSLFQDYNSYLDFQKKIDLINTINGSKPITNAGNTTGLPDTSKNPNPVNIYPGTAPSSTSGVSGSCYMDTNDKISTGRDFCCYSVLEGGCYSTWKLMDTANKYTATFIQDATSNEQSCKGSGFMYCDSSMKCCYN